MRAKRAPLGRLIRVATAAALPLALFSATSSHGASITAADTTLQCGGTACAPLSASQDVAPYNGVTATPKATCRVGDIAETQQGQAASGTYGFLCNLREVSHVGPPSTLALAVYGHCAYYQAGFGKGTDVVDLSNPSQPIITTTLTTPAMQYAHEGLRVSTTRGLLAAMAAGVGGEGYEDAFFDAYDVSKDCAHPRLLGSTLLPGRAGHEGTFSGDGKTFYATDVYGPGLVTALDVSKPAQPKVLWTVTGYAAHGITTSPDGNRLYVSTIATPGVSAVPNALGGCNGVVILDISQVQARRLDPQARMIDHFCWQDGIAAQVPFFFTSHRRPYLVVTDEGGSIASNGVTVAGKATGGHARIIDLSNERHPRVVSQLITQNQVENGGGAFHYCTPDLQVNPTVIGCTSWQGDGGFRVYNVRDVNHPMEIAYYSAPKNTSGSPSYFFPKAGLAVYADENYGLTVVRFVHGVWPFNSSTRAASGFETAEAPKVLSPVGLTSASLANQRLMRYWCTLSLEPARSASVP